MSRGAEVEPLMPEDLEQLDGFLVVPAGLSLSVKEVRAMRLADQR